MPSRKLIDLDPIMRKLASEFLMEANLHPIISKAGARVFLTCTYRSNEEQALEYAKGRTVNGEKTTNAAPGESAHNCTLEDGTPAAKGFDFAIELPTHQLDWNDKDPLWAAALDVGISLGLVSGSGWKTPHDSPHFELPNWNQKLIA